MIKREASTIKKYENPYFWLGLVGIIFSAAGVDVETLTSWTLMVDAIKNVISNPVAIMSVIAAINGVFVNHNTPGLKD